MKNLAGDTNCDETIKEELEQAGIFAYKLSYKVGGEVPATIVGLLGGWWLERAWYYWVAKNNDHPLPFPVANKLHEKFGNEVRVSGHCGCPAPQEWYDNPYYTGVPLYHIDTQEGLNAFAEAVREAAKG